MDWLLGFPRAFGLAVLLHFPFEEFLLKFASKTWLSGVNGKSLVRGNTFPLPRLSASASWNWAGTPLTPLGPFFGKIQTTNYLIKLSTWYTNPAAIFALRFSRKSRPGAGSPTVLGAVASTSPCLGSWPKGGNFGQFIRHLSHTLSQSRKSKDSMFATFHALGQELDSSSFPCSNIRDILDALWEQGLKKFKEEPGLGLGGLKSKAKGSKVQDLASLARSRIVIISSGSIINGLALVQVLYGVQTFWPTTNNLRQFDCSTSSFVNNLEAWWICAKGREGRGGASGSGNIHTKTSENLGSLKPRIWKEASEKNKKTSSTSLLYTFWVLHRSWQSWNFSYCELFVLRKYLTV